MSSKSAPVANNIVNEQDSSPSRKWLYPTTPCCSKRYDPRDSNPRNARMLGITAGKYSKTHDPAPPYTGDQEWQKHTHPEGKAYYSRGIAPRLITEIDVTTNGASEALDVWVTVILNWAQERGFRLTEWNELFIDPELDTGICDYYFADHDSRAIFWLEDSDASDLGLPPACSDGHLRLAIEENYWKHVEMFCMHLSSGLPRDSLEELIGIYVHGRGDLATSQTSTFYFTPEMTDVHIKLLKQCRAIRNDPIIYAFIGRLWGYICNYKFQNFHGEAHSRLDRTASVFEHKEEKPSIFLRFISTLMFGHPEALRQQLREQRVDDLVMERVWTAFISDQTAEWSKLTQWTLGLMIASALATSASPTPVITYTSSVLCSVGLLVSVFLSQHLKRFMKDGVDDGDMFLAAQNGKMMPLAIVLSLPRVTFIWSLILLAAQAVIMLFSAIPLPVGIAVCASLLMLATCIGWIMFPTHRLSLSMPSFTLPRLYLPYSRRYERIPDAESCGSD